MQNTGGVPMQSSPCASLGGALGDVLDKDAPILLRLFFFSVCLCEAHVQHPPPPPLPSAPKLGHN